MKAGALACAAAVALLLLAPALALGEQPAASLPDIEDEVMCLVCGTALNIAESPQADSERDFIRDLIAQGLDKQQIEDRLVVEYGPEVLATPSSGGFDLTAWIVPIGGVLAAALAVGFGARRWRRDGERLGTDGAEVAMDGVEPEERSRLEADLTRYGR